MGQEGHRNRSRARLGGSVLFRTMAGKVVGERLKVTGLGALARGWRVLVPGSGSGTSVATQPSSRAWLRVEGLLLTYAQAEDVSSVSHTSPLHFL